MTVTLQSQSQKRRLIAAGHDNTNSPWVAGVNGGQIWYEDIMTIGTLIPLTASIGTIDTTDNLTMFAGFQKCFVVNGASTYNTDSPTLPNRLWVADFVNTHITYATGLTYAPSPGEILQQTNGSDIAQMVVDYVSPDGKNIYGYTTSTTPFLITSAVTSITTSPTSTMSPPSFAPSSAPSDARPHWYAWESYAATTAAGGVAAYQGIPPKAYLGCLYRGRCVLSGNPQTPHQWYMSRQANPWDWAYLPLDSQSAVTGGDGTAGKCGDIITALAPYQDDYLIMGAASSIWVLRGDPAAGGSFDLMTDATGIFGANSWCWDSARNFYFLGNNGIYVIKPGTGGVPENLTQNCIPSLVKNLQLNASVHRVTLTFDKENMGIQIAKTTLSTGDNQNYWLDLRTGGFFPENYPQECGVYSSLFYDSIGTSYRKMVMGCTDGYIRFFDTASANDIGSTVSNPIDAYFTVGPQKMGKSEDDSGRLDSLTIVEGGDTSTETTQSGPVTYSIFTGSSAEEVISQVKEDATPLYTGSVVTGGGRKARIRTKARGTYLAAKLENDALNQTFAIEKVVGVVLPAGRQK